MIERMAKSFHSLLFLFSLFLFSLCITGSASKHVHKDSMIPRSSFAQTDVKPHPDRQHQVLIAIKHNNMDVLEAHLLEISDPHSPSYQQWLSRKEVNELVDNREGYQAVQEWLSASNATIDWTSSSRHFIKATTTISNWETLLQTKFHAWQDRLLKPTSPSIHRAEHYSIPTSLHPHIHAIFNTVQSPPVMTSRAIRRPLAATKSSHSRKLLTFDGYVTPQFLAQHYKIGSRVGNENITQSVFETAASGSEPHFSSDDLRTFLSQFNIPFQEPFQYPPGVDYDTPMCGTMATGGGYNCDEGNLDLQYIMAISQNTETIYWAEESSYNPFVTWAVEMRDDLVGAKTTNAIVTSISFGATEQSVDAESMQVFNQAAIILGAQGSTILVSSGDNGAPGMGMEGRCSPSMCTESTGNTDSYWPHSTQWTGQGYYPSFPATSPYVTAVGATMGPEIGVPEMACQSDKTYSNPPTYSTESGIITSGGGFSTYYPQPEYQKGAVDKYFAHASNSSQLPKPGFNPLGRAFPDIALIGVKYFAVIQGAPAVMYGTSASAPVVAGMVSLINALRYELGKPPIGFINPTLYQAGSQNATFFRVYNISHNNQSLFNDITQGNNLCCGVGQTTDPTGEPKPLACCQAGFHAAPGWDPVTGWGSIHFTKFAALFSVAAPYIPQAPSPTSVTTKATKLGLWAILVIITVVGGCVLSIAAAIQLCYAYRTNSANARPVTRVINGEMVTINSLPIATASTIQNPSASAYTASTTRVSNSGMSEWQDFPQAYASPSIHSSQATYAVGPTIATIETPTTIPRRLQTGNGAVLESTSYFTNSAAHDQFACPHCGKNFTDAVLLIEHVDNNCLS